MAVAKSLELLARSGSTLARIRERLPTYLSDFREDPRWLLMFLFARTDFGRNLHWSRQADVVPDSREAGSLFQASTADVVRGLTENGLYQGLNLPPETVSAIVNFANTTPCFGNHDRRLDLLPADQMAKADAGNPVTSGHYFERISDSPDIMGVQKDPLLHSVARNYLGKDACVISTRLWWSFPAEGAKPTETREMLHFDLDDWRMLKFFFYLTPVGENAGPHLFVRGSHRHHLLKHQLSITVGRPADEVLEAYGAERLLSIHGDAGTGFAEDPFGFHAGSLAQSTPRLMLEVGFGLTPPNRRRFYGERIIK